MAITKDQIAATLGQGHEQVRKILTEARNTLAAEARKKLGAEAVEKLDMEARDKLGYEPLAAILNDNTSSSPLLHRVSFWGDNFETAKLLIHHGADVNQTNSEGDALLHFQAIDEPKSEFLIMHGADVHLKNRAGRTPIQLEHWSAFRTKMLLNGEKRERKKNEKREQKNPPDSYYYVCRLFNSRIEEERKNILAVLDKCSITYSDVFSDNFSKDEIFEMLQQVLIESTKLLRMSRYYHCMIDIRDQWILEAIFYALNKCDVNLLEAILKVSLSHTSREELKKILTFDDNLVRRVRCSLCINNLLFVHVLGYIPRICKDDNLARDLAKILIEYGAEVNQTNSAGYTALDFVSDDNVKFLIQQGARINKNCVKRLWYSMKANLVNYREPRDFLQINKLILMGGFDNENFLKSWDETLSMRFCIRILFIPQDLLSFQGLVSCHDVLQVMDLVLQKIPKVHVNDVFRRELQASCSLQDVPQHRQDEIIEVQQKLSEQSDKRTKLFELLEKHGIHYKSDPEMSKYFVPVHQIVQLPQPEILFSGGPKLGVNISKLVAIGTAIGVGIAAAVKIIDYTRKV